MTPARARNGTTGRRYRAVAATLAVCVLATAIVFAAGLDLIGGWGRDVNLNLRTEAILPLASSPDTVLAGTSSGVSASQDGGDTWTSSSAGLPPGGVHALAEDDSQILAGTNSGIYRSTNGGALWSFLALSGTTVRSIAVQDGIPTVILAAGTGGVYRDAGSGVWPNVLAVTDAFGVAVDRGVRLSAIAGTTTGAHISFDRGQTWTGTTGLSGSVYSVEISGLVPPVFYAGTGNGLYRAVLGTGWTKATGLPSKAVRAIETQGDFVYAGTDADAGGPAWASADFGSTFETYSKNILAGQGVLSLALSTSGNLHAGTTANAYRRATVGLVNPEISPLPLPPTLPPIPPTPIPTITPTTPLPPTLPPIPPTPIPTITPTTPTPPPIPPTPIPTVTPTTPTPLPTVKPPNTGWIPGNAGILWWQVDDATFPVGYPFQPPRQPAGELAGAFWMTRRVAASPFVPGVMHLGSFWHGMYMSAGGGAWAMLNPGCVLPVNTPRPLNTAGNGALNPTYQAFRRAVISIDGLIDACGIEEIVYDRFMPHRIYAAAYDVVSLTGNPPSIPTLGEGGVYVSDTLGVRWTRLLGGIRGSALAVYRASPIAPAKIIVGYIQRINGAGGVDPTPNNNTASLSMSNNDGKTWTHIDLPATTCSDTITSSKRLTATIVINPANPNKIYAGTNAGLYVSADGGNTYTLVKQVCGGVWGIAVNPTGTLIYIGDATGAVSVADTSNLAFSPVTTLAGGFVQSLVLDPRDKNDLTLYGATWATNGGGGRVYRIKVSASGSTATALTDSVLTPVNQAWPAGVPRPFPLTHPLANGQAPSLFLAILPAAPNLLYVSTIFRGVFFRSDSS